MWIIKYIYHKWLRNKQNLDLSKIGKPTFISTAATFGYPKNISVGRYCRIGHYCHIDGEGGVEIGDGTIFGPYVTILSSSHDYKQDKLLPYSFNNEILSVTIGKGCWLGWGAMVRPGIHIGDGAIIAMGSVITQDVPSGALVGGNPAKVIKKARTQEVIDQLTSNDDYFLKEVFDKGKTREGEKLKISNIIR